MGPFLLFLLFKENSEEIINRNRDDLQKLWQHRLKVIHTNVNQNNQNQTMTLNQTIDTDTDHINAGNLTYFTCKIYM